MPSSKEKRAQRHQAQTKQNVTRFQNRGKVTEKIAGIGYRETQLIGGKKYYTALSDDPNVALGGSTTNNITVVDSNTGGGVSSHSLLSNLDIDDHTQYVLVDGTRAFGGNWTNAGHTIADLGTVTTADINGGNIDGTTIATSDIDVTGQTLSLDDNQISGDKVEGGTIASITIEQLNGAMDVNDEELTNVNIDSGAIDNTVIGANSQAAGDFTAIGAVSAGTIVGTTIDATTNFTIDGLVLTADNISNDADLNINTNGTTALTIDTNQNSTFAGEINTTLDSTSVIGDLKNTNTSGYGLKIQATDGTSTRYIATFNDKDDNMKARIFGDGSATFSGDVTVDSGTTTTLAINSSTHNASVANEAKLEFGYGHSGSPDAVGYIKLNENSTNSFDGTMTIGVPYNDTSGGSDTRDVLTLKHTGNVIVPGGVLILGTADTSSGHINAFENMSFNIDTDNDDTNRFFEFGIDGSDGTGTELMRLTEDGHLGIGADNPVAKFVVSDGGAGGLEIEPEIVSATNRITNYNRTTSAYTSLRIDALTQQFLISGSEKVRLDSTGMGIGSNAPDAILHLQDGNNTEIRFTFSNQQYINKVANEWNAGVSADCKTRFFISDGSTTNSNEVLALSGDKQSSFFGLVNVDSGGTSRITIDGNNTSGDDGNLQLYGHTSSASRAYISINNGVSSGGQDWYVGALRGNNSFAIGRNSDFNTDTDFSINSSGDIIFKNGSTDIFTFDTSATELSVFGVFTINPSGGLILEENGVEVIKIDTDRNILFNQYSQSLDNLYGWNNKASLYHFTTGYADFQENLSCISMFEETTTHEAYPV